MNIVDFSPNGYTTVLGSSCSETLSIFDLRNSRVPIGVIESSEDLVQAKFSQTGQTCQIGTDSLIRAYDFQQPDFDVKSTNDIIEDGLEYFRYFFIKNSYKYQHTLSAKSSDKQNDCH